MIQTQPKKKGRDSVVSREIHKHDVNKKKSSMKVVGATHWIFPAHKVSKIVEE